MMEIRDQQLRLMLLAHLVREVQRATDESRPPPAGLATDQITSLRSLTADDLVRLSEMPEPRVAVDIDGDAFAHGLRQADYAGRRARQVEHFVRHGATAAMLTALFKLSSNDVVLKRKLFAGAHERLRRPPMPPAAVREAIQARWWGIAGARGDNPRPEDFEALHAAYPTYTYATLWAVVHEFDS